ncbi:MAG: sulfite exporter TauE/SafE family protein [Candidatus Kerfeldbacteria bacterium]|nr:sulfite exporter TauE/SafE family protein [Candidatus Kerfeldbacteria bacterium]
MEIPASLPQPWVGKYQLANFLPTQQSELSQRLRSLPQILQVDINYAKSLLRVVANSPVELNQLQAQAKSLGISLSPTGGEGMMELNIEGMHCHSCELTIERSLKKLPGVAQVDVNAATGLARLSYQGSKPSWHEIKEVIHQAGYKVRGLGSQAIAPTVSRRPRWWELALILAFVLIIGRLLARSGLLKPNIGVIDSSSIWAVFLLGLVAASSSCVAVSGGLLLSSAAKFNERYLSSTLAGRLRPVWLFIIGRLLSYGLLGGLIGLIGQALTPSPLVTSIITIVAALYMFIMGLDMLHLAPVWLKRLSPRLPKRLSHRVLEAENHSHPLAPFFLGAGTFFLPCGFTQALQLYALTTGSFFISAWLLFGFALGTAPALFALGLVSGSLKGQIGSFFFKVAGVTVVVLGLWNFQNGLTIAGYPLELSHLWSSRSQASSLDDPNVSFDGQQQVLRMTVEPNGYSPSRFVLRQGVPARWEIEASQAQGCISVLQAPKLGIKPVLLNRSQLNVVEFTPRQAGTFTFTCSMGMYRGQITVVPKV